MKFGIDIHVPHESKWLWKSPDLLPGATSWPKLYLSREICQQQADDTEEICFQQTATIPRGYRHDSYLKV